MQSCVLTRPISPVCQRVGTLYRHQASLRVLRVAVFGCLCWGGARAPHPRTSAGDEPTARVNLDGARLYASNPMQPRPLPYSDPSIALPSWQVRRPSRNRRAANARRSADAPEPPPNEPPPTELPPNEPLPNEPPPTELPTTELPTTEVPTTDRSRRRTSRRQTNRRRRTSCR